MKAVLFVLLGILLVCCKTDRKDQSESKSDSLVSVPVIIDTVLEANFGSRPLFPKYSGQIFTNDENESVITPLLDSLLDEYSHRNYFNIETEGKTWHFDQHKHFRALTTEQNEKFYKDHSIYLFENNRLVASYRDVDMRGQDTQSNRERIVTSQCPGCGVSFNLVLYDTLVSLVNEARIEELSQYYIKECRELLDWLAQASLSKTEGNNLIFERKSPYNARFTVNAELYNKYIKLRKQ